MKQKLFFTLSLVFILLLVSCEMIGTSLMGFIDEYTNNAAIMSHEVTGSSRSDASGTTCIDRDGTVTLFIRNPKNYELDFQYSFKDAGVQRYYNDNPYDGISFEKTDNSIYTLVFPEELLSDMDECDVTQFDEDTGWTNITTKDLSGTISLFEHETQRPFDTYDISLHVDSLPEEIGAVTVMQTDDDYSGTTAEYYVCFRILKSRYNKDFKTLKINSVSYPITYNGSYYTIGNPTGATDSQGLSTNAPDALYAAIEGGAVFDSSDVDYTYFYFKTGDYRSDSEKKYSLTLTDEAGLSVSATISNKAEKLSPVHFYLTGIEDELDNAGHETTADDTKGTATLKIVQDGTTTSPDSVVSSSATPQIICYLTDITNPDNGTTTQTFQGSTPLSIPLDVFRKYQVEAYATCRSFITSDTSETGTVEILHTPNLYVSSSGSNETGNGSKNKPFRTIQKCIDLINEEGEDWIDTGDGDDYFINVLSNITPAESDYQDGADYLVSNGNFSGKLTIQGVDASGNAAKRTIDAQGKGGLLSWTAISNEINNLTLKNLKFSNGYANTESSSAGLYFYTVGRNGPSNEKFRATLTNCDITGMTGTGGYGLYFYGGNGSLQDENTSTVTMTDCTISNNEKQGIFQTYTAQSRATYEKLILDGNTKIQNNAEGGIFSKLGLCLKSKNVTISGNSGYGVSASAFSYIEIEGATITNNKDSSGYLKNIWLGESTNNSGVVTRAFINVTGDLTGSRIGVWTETGPESVLDDPIEFATYDEGNKPGTGVFTSDTGLDVNLGETSATLVYVPTPTISGSLDIPDQFFDDIRVTATGIQDTENAKMIVTPQFIDSENTVLDDVTINSVSIVDGSAEMPNTAGSVRLWDFTDGQLVVYCTAKPKSNGQIQLVPLMASYSSSGKMFFKVVFTYKGKTYSALVMN